ncbi:SDR family NAD(P)-dependent oxidoreductase [Arcticibacter tournemirensis]|uniref:SDR family oxidoreductase n=1 Tax=Arcticibacter tournemirensis TaxID=699437 RepID=A0A4Q0MBN9_9SPHI|nr:SDR family oxidoreductase [Arcticibacter tournemirensis]RXF70575.1 SDR family oxidoreductase [Arcticibacter tournemirensis]
MQEFKNKVVVISGALGDIGLSIASRYLESGAIVVLGDQLQADAASVKLLQLDSYQEKFEYKQLDVSDYRQVETWISEVEDRYGKIDCCIANAARVTIKNFRTLSPEEWSLEMRVNVDGAFYFANFAAQSMVRKAVGGNIIFLGSWAAHAVHENIPAYSVSKAAVRMINQTMALEYAHFGIRVNEIAPGYVNAGLSKTVWSELPEQKVVSQKKVPLNKIMEAEAVAVQVLWLTSHQCQHVTGSTFLMDGGLSLLRP